jgi:hypothetical protein
MSQLITGEELLSGIGGTQANSAVDANAQRRETLLLDTIPIQMPGEAQICTIATLIFPYDVLPYRIIFNSKAGAPTGGPLTLSVGAATQSLTAGQTYVKQNTGLDPAVSGNWITADTPFNVDITAANAAQWPLFLIQFRKRKL